ncbi:MAG: hypothetical protein SFU86_22955 [Pirellulaceae bacterium]|nr:hypothetical protein [Pirellulaceae bacterium]
MSTWGSMRWSLPVVAGWLALVAGCQPADDGPPLVPIEGRVLFEGQPLEGATIALIPIGETKGQGGTARTDAEGKFVLKTPDGKRTGGMPGQYQVRVSKLVNPDGSTYILPPDVSPIDSAGRELLPPAYSDLGQLRLQADVGPAGAQELKFELVKQPR